MADDQPMWGNNRAVAPTLGAAIVVVDLGKNITVKGHHLAMIKDSQFDGREWADPHKHIAKFFKIYGMFRYGNTNNDPIKLKLFPSSFAGDAKVWFNELSLVVEVLTHHWSVTTSLWEVPKMKKPAMPMEVTEEEDIEETTTIGVPEFGETDNQEMKTETPNLERTFLLFHQHPKRSSTSLTLKKPCENSWSLKNRRMTLSKISSSILKPKSSKDKRITKPRFRILRQNLVDSPTNVPLDQLNEHVNVVFTRSGLTYDSPVNPNAKTTVIHDDCENKVDEAKKKLESSSSKQTESDPPPLMAYKTKNLYPQRLRKEKMEERYAKFIDLIKEVRINVPLVDVLAGIPNYGKFLKDLVSNKSKMEQISIAFLNEECSAIVQNKLPPKLGDPRSFLIMCTVEGSIEYLTLDDLGAIGKFMFPTDLVILQMEEDDKVPLILGRPFLHTADAIIRVKNKELNLGVEDDRITVLIDKVMWHSQSNDDTCFRMDVIDEVTKEELDALLDESKPFSTTSEKINESSLHHEFGEFMAIKIKEIHEQEEEVEDILKNYSSNKI
ncbi:reverse transcriptase domain-containing protein [Tanacetum coccineum]